MKWLRVNVALDAQAIVDLDRVSTVWGLSRSATIRRLAREGVEWLEKPKQTIEVRVPSQEPARTMPVMLTGRQLAEQQRREREGRRGVEDGDQSRPDEDI